MHEYLTQRRDVKHVAGQAGPGGIRDHISGLERARIACSISSATPCKPKQGTTGESNVPSTRLSQQYDNLSARGFISLEKGCVALASKRL